MKRSDVLMKLGYTVPHNKTKRVIVHSDVKNEADDHFAIMHHLLTPSIDVRGIIAGHFEWIARSLPEMIRQAAEAGIDFQENSSSESPITPRGESMMRSYEEGRKILELAGIDDVPLFKGSAYELSDINKLPESEGADFIIKEALREDDDRPLYVALLGGITDLAIALLKEPRITERLTAIWIGGGDYPSGGNEFNLMQDISSANVVFESPVAVWQIPSGTYRTVEFSLAELVYKVKPCGEIGAYLCQQMLDFNDKMGKMIGLNQFPHGESWSIGDNPTISVLMQNTDLDCWHTEKAPHINDDCTYTPNPNGKDIRVYDSVDTRLTLEDLYAKLALCYR